MSTEYLRRNLLVAKAIGARANAGATLERLEKCAYAPKWLREALRGIVARCEPLPADLAQWRDTAEDAPDYVRSAKQHSERQP